MTIEQKIDVALARVYAGVKLFDPIEVFGLYSGGHDSFSACYVASLHPRFSGVVHVNTGIGVEATREHVRTTCRQRGWKLMEYKATENITAKGVRDPKLYEEMVLEYGFPGPSQHQKMYINLKERAIERLERDCGACGRGKMKSLVLYVGGQRSQESVRRMGNVEEIQLMKRSVWVAPIHDWTKCDTSDLIEYAKAKRNPVVDLIHKSGECLCGAFAKPGELQELSLWPETRPAYERIVALQEKVRASGFPWGWEDSPPKEYLEEKGGQIMIPEVKQFLCWSCNSKRTA